MTKKKFGHLTGPQMRKVEYQHHSGLSHEQIAEAWGISVDTVQAILDYRSTVHTTHPSGPGPVAFKWS